MGIQKLAVAVGLGLVLGVVGAVAAGGVAASDTNSLESPLGHRWS